ncbi:MAG TPA: HIT domain-containing protein [Terriglobia bacterium]|nr:HIT domain-containing protein [Terriglobia bacterium]
MDHLWTPWRYRYVSETVKGAPCVFCRMAAETGRDRENFVVHRAGKNFVVLNLFPYTSGHAMVVPYAHAASLTSLAELDSEALREMMTLARDLEGALQALYRPEGYNFGMNLGCAAGAGIADHLHLHFLPRWSGDTNFMTVVGETRLLPEDLSVTYDKLSGFFRRQAS